MLRYTTHSCAYKGAHCCANQGADESTYSGTHCRSDQGPDGGTVRFEIDPFRKRCLMEGLDDIGLTMEKGKKIDAFEEKYRLSQPWL